MRVSSLTLMLLIFGYVDGQNLQRFSLRFDLGLNSTIPYESQVELFRDFPDPPTTNYKSNIGYNADLCISFHFSDKLSIESGASYVFTRLKKDLDIALTKEQGIISCEYVYIPLNLRYSFSQSIPVTFTIGPYIGFPLSIIDKGTSIIDTSGFYIPGGNPQDDPVIASIDPVSSYEWNLKSVFKKFDTGLSLELQYPVIKANRFSVFVFSRFKYGLINVYLDENPNKWKIYIFSTGIGAEI